MSDLYIKGPVSDASADHVTAQAEQPRESDQSALVVFLLIAAVPGLLLLAGVVVLLLGG